MTTTDTTATASQPAPLDLDAIEAGANDATPGPWYVTRDPLGIHVENGDGAGRIVMQSGQDRGRDGRTNAEFIAHARTDVPELVAEVRRLRARAAELEQTLTATRQQLRNEATRIMRRPAHPPVAADTAWWLRRLAECPVCSGPSRETAGLVCQACGRDWGAPERGPLSTTPPAGTEAQ